MSEYEGRAYRRAVARNCATGMFAATVITALIAVALCNYRWATAAGVEAFAAFIAAMVALP